VLEVTVVVDVDVWVVVTGGGMLVTVVVAVLLAGSVWVEVDVVVRVTV